MAHEADRSEHTVSTRIMELIVSGLFMAASTLVMYDNWRIGARWAEDGPQAGYFPFRVGAIMFIASAVTFGVNFLARSSSPNFVDRSQMRQVLQVLVPTIVYVVLIGPLGIYVASAIFIAFFMRYLGKYGWAKIAAVSVGTMVVFFLMFEVWFKVPLPKGPLEAAFGFA